MALAPRIRKSLRFLALLLAMLLAVVTLPLVAMQLPVVRSYVLEKLVQQAKKSLPGELRVQRATWPSTGNLLLQEVHWVTDGDTLAAIDQLELRWKPWGLARREIDLPLVAVRLSRLDVPRINLALAAASSKPGASPSKPQTNGRASKSVPWLREGAVRGVPSLQLQDVRIDLADVRVADSLLIESVQLRLQADLRAGKMPNLVVQQLQVKLQDPAVEISEGHLKLDLHTGQLEALIRSRDGSPWDLAVTANTTATDRIDLQVQVRHADHQPLSLLTVHGDLLSREERVVGVRFTSRISTPGVALLRQMPALRSAVASVPDLQGIQLDSDGVLAWLPSWRLDLSTGVAANAWLRGGRAQLHFHNDSLVVSDVELRLADATLRGDWLRASKAMQGQLHVQVDGSEWMSDLLPDVAPLDSLAVDLKVSAQQQEEVLTLAASLRAGLARGNARIDDLQLEASASSLQDLLFRVRSRARGWELAAAGRLVLGDSLLLFLEPLHVQQGRGAELLPWSHPLRIPKGSTRIAWQAQSGLRVVDLGLTGDLGRAVIEASWQAERGGRATLLFDWPRPPEILLRALADSTWRESIAQQWGDQKVPRFEAGVRFGTTAGAHHVEAQGQIILPGPRLLAAALPESIQVHDLDALHAGFVVQYRQDSLETTWNARLDLDETAWLDSSSVVVEGRHDSLFVDSLRLVWDGLDLRLAGVADSVGVDLSGSVQFDADRFLARLPQEALRSIALQAAATWRITGSPEAPNIDSEVQARLETPWGGAPLVLSSFAMRQGVLSTATLDTPDGVALQGLPWQRLHVDLRPESIDSVDGSRIHLTLASEQQELRSVLWLHESPGMILRADTLYVRVFDRELLTDQPFVIEEHAVAWQLRDLRLSGSLGTATADLLAGADTLSGLLNLDLQLPDQPDLLHLPEGVWPASLRLRAAVADNDSLAVFLQASGLQLGNHPQLSVVADIRAVPDSTHFRIAVVDAQATLVDSQGLLPLAWSMHPLSFAMRADSLRMQATFKDFPIPDVSGDPRAVVDFLDRAPEVAWAHLNGTLQLAGPLAEPRGHGYWTLQPQAAALKGYKAHVFVGLAQGTRSWGPALQKQLERLSTGTLLSEPGAGFAMWIQQDSLRILDAAAHLPVSIGFENATLKIDSGARLRAAVRATQVDLGSLGSLLPPRTAVEGVVSVALQAEGPWQDPQLSGGFTFKDLAVRVPDGSRVRASGNIDLQGTARDPGVKGQVHVRDGLIRIPELPRTLLPVQGEALLLPTAAIDAAAPASQPVAVEPSDASADSSARKAVSVRRTPAAASLPRAARRDAQAVVEASGNNSDVFVKIPGAFWIRGRGFEVELSGNLQLTVREGQPRVVGELKAERGDLQLMASKFPMKSGRVLFFGDDETNPSLDLVMGRKYGDVSVEVVVQGTAKDPIIEFRSEPQLSEDEILSYVLFGRGTSQLNDSQTQRYDERVLALASLLTANLGEGITSRSGIDMVGLEQSAETSDRASLVVGKYLSPRVLLKYVQDLEQGQGYAVNVEYWLKGGLRLMTSTSRYNQSGMELNWSHDY